ncbi:MAG: hypothetical protein U9N52_13015 [Campylobacterota bacterium]|nr:hypothetical protein [Campylobacterota bacterium]
MFEKFRKNQLIRFFIRLLIGLIIIVAMGIATGFYFLEKRSV